MKKILIVINNLGIGGAERLVVDDIHEMMKRGFDVYLLTFKKEKKDSLMNECRLPEHKRMCIDTGTIWDLSSWIRTYRYINTIKPDKVFSHLWFSNIKIMPICWLLGITNCIIFEHNVYDLVKNKKMYFVDWLAQYLPKKIVAVSGAVKDSLVMHHIKNKHIVVVHNGINMSLYRKEKDIEYRKQFNIPRDVFVFITVGRLIDQKGIDILIRAFSKGVVGAHLVIVGQGPKEKELKKIVEDCRLLNMVHFLGARNDVPALLACSDCFVLASRWEGLGMVVLEAMASQLPVIISDFKAGKELIEHTVSGIVVPKEDEHALHDAMCMVMNNVPMQKDITKYAYKKVQQFSIEEHVNKILSL